MLKNTVLNMKLKGAIVGLVTCLAVTSASLAQNTADTAAGGEQQRPTSVAPTAMSHVSEDPTPEQAQTIDELHAKDLQIFIRRTQDFREVVDGIVRRNYQLRREFIDQSFQKRIEAEDDLAEKTRKNAIAYFEEFLRKYPRHPKYTPDAMYRLAELYYDDSYIKYLDDSAEFAEAQDRGMADNMELPTKEFDRTINIFRQLAVRYPKYRNIDGVYYLLGYCLNDTGHEEEARLAWLNLVCANKYQYDAEEFARERLKEEKPTDSRPAANLDTGVEQQAPARFVDPFARCQPITQNSRFFFESWWLIGNYHFDYDVSRYGVETAISAYQKLIEDPSHKFYDKGLYKLAWSYFKADMYPQAIDMFSRVVDFSDKQGPGKGSGMRPEAVQYLAVCFFTEDWDLDMMPDATSGIVRLQDPSMMPQDRPWTREVYQRLGDIYFDNEKNEEAIAVWRMCLKKWPLDSQAPFIQEKIALTYNKLRQYNQEILERGNLNNYGPDSEWWRANADDPAAQNEVAQMARDAILESAYFHHRTAQDLRQRGLAAQDGVLLQRAVEEYNLAADAYRSFIEQNPDTPDQYEITYNLAEALFWSGQYEAAKAQYASVRDSNLDDKYRGEAGEAVIFCLDEIIKRRIADGSLVIREEPPDLAGDPLAPPEMPLPPLVLERMNEREQLIKREPTHKNAATYQYQSAQNYYRYGHWQEAKLRYEELYKKYCKSDAVGVISWKTLLNMATEQNDIDEKERLALMQKERQCSVEGMEATAEGEIPIDDLLGDVAMTRALAQFKVCMSGDKEQEQEQEEDKESDDICSEAGGALVAAVDRAPTHPSADAALHNAALAYENAQRFDTAMQLYGRIVNDYPKSQWVDKCLFKQAFAANNFFEYEKALDNYRILADERRFKGSDYRVDAVYNSAYLLTNLQSYVAAVPYWQRYSREVKDPATRIEASFNAADMLYRAKKWRQAIDAYEVFINRHEREKAAGPFVVKAAYRAGLCQQKVKKRKQRQHWERTVELYQRLVNTPGSMSAEFAAESHFMLIEQDMRTFERFSIKGNQKAIDRKIKQGAEKVKDFELRYREVQKYRRPTWSLAAEFRIGYAFEVYAKALLNIPPPPLDRETQKLLKQLPPEDREMVMIEYEDKFRAAMEQYVAGAEEKAQAEYKIAVDLARQGNISNEWTLLALERMNAYDPENYPRQHNGVIEREENTLAVPPWAPEVN